MKSNKHTFYGPNCTCSCCRWHNHPAIKIILAAAFLAFIVDLAWQTFFGLSTYLYNALLGFTGIILMIIAIGWIISISCSCRGRHWIFGPETNPELLAKERYAAGDISRKDYLQILKDIN